MGASEEGRAKRRGVGCKRENGEDFKCERNEVPYFETTHASQQVEFFLSFVNSCSQQMFKNLPDL